MEKNFFCRCIINSNKKAVAEKIINTFLNTVIFNKNEILEFCEYWKDKNKYLCEFKFVLEHQDSTKILDSYLTLLSKISGTWTFHFEKEFSFSHSNLSAISENSRFGGIDWMNIETE